MAKLILPDDITLPYIKLFWAPNPLLKHTRSDCPAAALVVQISAGFSLFLLHEGQQCQISVGFLVFLLHEGQKCRSNP